LDEAEAKNNSLISPLQHLGGLASGLQTGIKVFESFTGWVAQRKNGTKKK
jgi:hypothetical protein